MKFGNQITKVTLGAIFDAS